jgi:hypothetical protein
MIQRCTNPNELSYKNYGGRGIRVCDRWRNSSKAFLSDMGEPPVGLMLERVDSYGNYEPSNCRWATRQEQNDNRPSWCIAVEVNGEPMNLKQAFKRFAAPGLTYRSVHKRITARAWPVAMALMVPNAKFGVHRYA